MLGRGVILRFGFYQVAGMRLTGFRGRGGRCRRPAKAWRADGRGAWEAAPRPEPMGGAGKRRGLGQNVTGCSWLSWRIFPCRKQR